MPAVKPRHEIICPKVVNIDDRFMDHDITSASYPFNSLPHFVFDSRNGADAPKDIISGKFHGQLG